MKVHYEILYRPTVLYTWQFLVTLTAFAFLKKTTGCHVSKNRAITRRHRLCFCVPGRTRRGTSPPQPTMGFGERRKFSQRGSGGAPAADEFSKFWSFHIQNASAETWKQLLAIFKIWQKVTDTEQFADCSNVAVMNRVSKHYTTVCLS